MQHSAGIKLYPTVLKFNIQHQSLSQFSVVAASVTSPLTTQQPTTDRGPVHLMMDQTRFMRKRIVLHTDMEINPSVPL